MRAGKPRTWVHNRKRKLAVPVARCRACLLDQVGELPQRRVHPRVDLHLVVDWLLAPHRIVLLPGHGAEDSGVRLWRAAEPLCRELREARIHAGAHLRWPPLFRKVRSSNGHVRSRSTIAVRRFNFGVLTNGRSQAVETR